MELGWELDKYWVLLGNCWVLLGPAGSCWVSLGSPHFSPLYLPMRYNGVIAFDQVDSFVQLSTSY